MNRQQKLVLAATAAVALVVGLGLGAVVFSPGGSAESEHVHAAGPVGSGAAPTRPTIWTCSMHPQIRQPEPGQCPICGMDLIPVEEGTSSDAGPRTMKMSESARALAEIQTTRVVRAFPEAEVRLVGKLDYDETRVKSLAARFPARIDELFVNFTGIRVEKGDHLAVIYSPDLLTAQRELLTAMQFDPGGATAQVAREKLRLWDLQPDQINAIIASGVPQDHFELRAPVGGTVVQKNIKEGDYVKTGDPLFRIADLNQLWLPLEAYESDLPWLRYGQDVSFSVESFPGEQFKGRIVFIDPLLDTRTRTTGVRVEVPNPQRRLKPGMLARAIVYARVASAGRVIAPELAGKWISPMHPEIIKDGPGKCDVCGMDLVPIESMGYETAEKDPPLLVPSSAVLRTGKRAVVYVALPDRDAPTFEGREIALGPRAGNVFLVADGLREGEEVVTNGAFKIDSALQIMAKPSMMNPAGGGPAPGHAHGGSPAPGTSGAGENTHAAHGATTGETKLSTDEAQKLLDPYFKLQAALAGDDLAAAHDAAREMLEEVGHTAGTGGVLHAIIDAETLEAIRRPHFDVLSSALAAAIKADEKAFERPIYLKHCPMVYPDHGADWLQPDEPTNNPYFGAAMLMCGETKAVLSGEEGAKGEGKGAKGEESGARGEDKGARSEEEGAGHS